MQLRQGGVHGACDRLYCRARVNYQRSYLYSDGIGLLERGNVDFVRTSVVQHWTTERCNLAYCEQHNSTYLYLTLSNRTSQVVIVQEDVLVLYFLQANVLFSPKTSSPRVEGCVGREVEDVLCLQTAYAWGVWQEDPQ